MRTAVASTSIKSFPSGHAMVAAYAATYMIIYMQKKVNLASKLKWIAILSHSFYVCWALAASLTRITDQRHHWWDVLAGDILGIACACLASKVRWGSIWSAEKGGPKKS